MTTLISVILSLSKFLSFLVDKQKVELLHCTNICATIRSIECVLRLAFDFLNRSEGPGRVFVLTIKYLLEHLKDVPDTKHQNVLLSYDMCNLCRLKVSEKPLHLARPYDQMSPKVSKIINSLHIRNYKECLEKYCADLWKEKFPRLNTPVAEQTFSWAYKLEKVCVPCPRGCFFTTECW